MQITWLGHSAFLLEDGKSKVLIDPFISGNPTFPDSLMGTLDDVTLILLTHGHGDHFGDTVSLAKKSGAKVVGIFELAQYLIKMGCEPAHVIDMNIGGTVDVGGVIIHMTQALHSSSIMDGDNFLYGGFPTGFVVEMGKTILYHAGDTGLFSDMNLIQDLYAPQIALLPIGDHYTMSPKAAAYACNAFLNCKTIIPMHYDTFPALTGKADTFKKLVTRGEVVVLTAGERLDV